MEASRIEEIGQLLEACRETDNSDLEAEKTAVVMELLDEVNEQRERRAREAHDRGRGET